MHAPEELEQKKTKTTLLKITKAAGTPQPIQLRARKRNNQLQQNF